MLVQTVSGSQKITTFSTIIATGFNMLGLNMISNIGTLGLVSTLDTLPFAMS